MAKTFYDLDIYKRSYKSALGIHKITQSFPKTEQYSLTDQIRRCSRVIPANIAEGFAKHHTSSKEFKRFLSMASGSANEMLVWLDFAHDLQILEKSAFETLKKEYIEIAKMIFTLSKNWIDNSTNLKLKT